MVTIALVDDENSIRTSVSLALQSDGFQVDVFNNGVEALEALETKHYDLGLFDIKMPKMDGNELLSKVRNSKSESLKKMPVIFLTSKDQEQDEIIGLRMGAADYITKPFSHLELLARVEAVLKRTYPNLYSDSLRYEDIKIDIKSHKVYRKNNLIKLSPKEYDLLVNFVINPKLVFSREQLLDKFWGLESDVELRTVDVHIRRLRKAINIENCKEIIRTIRSTGYALD